MNESKSCTISSKGQITLPISVRKELQVEAGDKVVFKSIDNTITIEKVIESHICPCCNGVGKIGIDSCVYCNGDGEIQFKPLAGDVLMKLTEANIDAPVYIVKVWKEEPLQLLRFAEDTKNYYLQECIKNYNLNMLYDELDNKDIDTVIPISKLQSYIPNDVIPMNEHNIDKLNNLYLSILKRKVIKQSNSSDCDKYINLFSDEYKEQIQLFISTYK